MSNEHLYSHDYAEVFGCAHRWTVRYEDKQFCHQCGIFCGLGVRVFKTLKLKYNTFFDPLKLLKQALEPHEPLDLSTHFEYLQVRVQLIDFIFQVADLLHLSPNTGFLAIQYIDQLEAKREIPHYDYHLYAATALMLAAKSSELDEKIPFISKLKRYASMTSNPDIKNYGTSDFRNAECRIIQALNWKLQQLTLLDRVEYLMTLGILDDDDSLSKVPSSNSTTPLKEMNSLVRSLFHVDSDHYRQKSQSQVDGLEKKVNSRLKELTNIEILDIVRNVEAQYKSTCISIIKDNMVFQQEQVTLALACIAYLRKNLGLLNIWSQQLQCLTSFSAQQISSTVSQIISIFSKAQRQTVNYNSKLPTQSLTSYSSVSRQTSSNLLNSGSSLSVSSKFDQNIKPKRKIHQYTYLNVNENNSFSSFARDLDRTKSLKLNTLSCAQPQLVRISSTAFQGKLFH